MDGLLVPQSGIDTHQMLIEEPDNLRKNIELRRFTGTPS